MRTLAAGLAGQLLVYIGFTAASNNK